MNTDLAAQAAMDKLHRDGFDSLSDQEKTIATVWLFESGVANGGFKHYYASAAGDVAFHAPAALAEIGAGQLSEIAAGANAVFGSSGPPRDRNTRRQLLDSLGPGAEAQWKELESRYFECSEDADELMDRLVSQPVA